MGNKLQCYKVALLLAALAFVFKTSAGKYFGLSKNKPGHLWTVTKKDEFTLEKLSKLLELEFVEPSRLNFVLTRDRLAQFLASTKDKDKEGGVLGQFTVNQLLALNDFYEKDCNDDKINERHELCDQLSDGKKVVQETNPLGVAYDNLHWYCKRTLITFKTWCQPSRIASAAKSLKHVIGRLSRFEEIVREYIQENEVKGGYSRDLVVRKVLEMKDLFKKKLGTQDIERIPDDCNRFLAAFKPFMEYKKYVNDNYKRLFSDCEAIVDPNLNRSEESEPN